MKTLILEEDKPSLGRKPKKPLINQNILAKFGSKIYHCDNVKSVSLRISLRNGTSLLYSRDEDRDEFDRRMRERDDD